jgi:putative phosphoesterase
MRIALISDIHANRYALNALLQFLEENPDITTVLNAGDLINVGPHPLEVVDTVLDDPRFIHVLGNNEEALATLGDDPGHNRHRSWTAQHLGPERTARLLALPRQQLIEREGRRILLVHSRCESTSDLPLIYHHGRSLREFSADYNAEEPDIVCFGHTHAPFYLQLEQRWFINPGSLGPTKERTSSFAVLTLDDNGVAVQFHALSWDREKFAGDLIKRDVPDKEFILQHYYGVNSIKKW